MLENDRMETASTEVTSIWRRNDIEKSTWRIHRYFVDFESRSHVEISTSNRCHNFHVDSPFKIDVISTNFPRGISTSNRWRIEEDVSVVADKEEIFFFITLPCLIAGEEVFCFLISPNYHSHILEYFWKNIPPTVYYYHFPYLPLRIIHFRKEGY